MSKPNEKLEAVFEAALALETEAQRAEYLNRACPDPELRREVESLLAAHQNPDSVFAEKTVRVEAAPTEKPGDRIGRYKLLQRIGEGGCGVVYMAEQEEPVRRRVALKVIKLGMDTKQVIARFEAERQALAIMDHPNIAKVLDAGATETGRPFFVMELVRGVKITDFCNQKNLSTRERLDLFIQVCRAVQHAHQKGIIHRDLKPSNILVTSDDGVPVPKVIDFGIAKATQGRLTDHTVFTAFEQFIGTPAYMSPEQAELSLHEVDTRTDIYSLGVLLYELLTGQTPFDAKELLAAGLDAMRRTIREVEPVKPSTRLTQELVAAPRQSAADSADEKGGALPRRRYGQIQELIHLVRGDLDWIVMKCLEKDRARRYETANGLAADLARHLNDEPIVARPASRLYKFQKTVRRHKLAFAAAAAILVVLAAGSTLTTWQAERAQNRARAEAEKARQNEAGLRQTAENAENTAQTEASRAEAAAMDSKRTLSASDFLQAVRFIAEDNAYDALPYLARSLSVNPANDAALTRLATLLTYRTWMLPTAVLKHGKPVNSAEYSLDGKRIVTASADGTARVWDAQTYQPLIEPMKHPFSVTSAQFSPDGKRIVTVSDDLTTRVWDAQTGQPVTGPMKHGSLVASVQFSPDGKRIVTGSWNNKARIWDAETGQPLTEPLGEETRAGKYSVNTAAYHNSVDGRTTVNFSVTKPVTAQFTPDGERIITVEQDGTTRVWNAQTGESLADLAVQGSPARSKQLSPDGKRKISISPRKTARVLDAQTGQPLTEPMEHGGNVSTAQFSPNGQRILTASGDNAAYLWEAQTAPSLPLSLPVLLTLDRPQFSPDGQRIVTASQDGTARVWDAQTGQPLTEPMKHGGSAVKVARFSPDDRRIVTASDDYIVRIWDAQTGQPLTESTKHEGPIYSVEFSPDGKRMVTGSSDNTARVWDTQTGQPLTEPMKQGAAGVRAAQFSPDGKRIVTDSGTVRVWDAQTGQPVTEPIKLGSSSVEFCPDGRRIVTASGDVARVWDAQTGQPLTEPMKHGAEVKAARFSLDGKRIVTASGDWTARVWDAQTGQPLTDPMKHESYVQTAQFSRDGKRIVTASGQTARVWDAQTAQPLTEPMTHGGGLVPSAQFSPDGKRILTASTGSPARVWDIAPTPAGFPDWLVKLAEAISGKVLNKEGVLEATRLNRVETLNQIRQKLAAQPDDDWVVWGRWLLADRATRTISPFAKVTVPEYIERLIKEKTRPSLDEAEQLAAGKPEVLQRISETRATLEQPKK